MAFAHGIAVRGLCKQNGMFRISVIPAAQKAAGYRHLTVPPVDIPISQKHGFQLADIRQHAVNHSVRDRLCFQLVLRKAKLELMLRLSDCPFQEEG